ncbi:hypothetical protein, partial [Nonomuraea sp. NPDC001831]|uniref:hypothetical protein n=1 Tax=Nonomuraea sp. NPDC001831 TaxID=3364340 RepID=UPI0036BFA482
MKRKALLAAVAGLATAATMTLQAFPVSAAPPGATPAQDPGTSTGRAADPAAVAAAVADKAVSSQLDNLSRGPDEAYSRRSVTP